MLRLSLRNLLAHKGRTLLTALAVVLGVGFVVGSFVVTDSLRASIDQLFTDITSGVDVSVRAESDLPGAGATESRGRIPADLVPVVQDVDGVAAAEGTVGGYAQLVDAQGEPMTTTGAPFLGVSWGHVDALRPATLDTGRGPVGAGEIAIDRGTAQDAGFDVGDRTTVLLADGSQPEVEIVGIFTFGEANNLLGARLTAFDVDVAADLLGAGDEVDSVDVLAEPGTDPDELAARIQGVLPDGAEAVTATRVSDEASESVAGYMDLFRNILLGFAAVALFVAAFTINNTFSIVVGQRTRQLALIRAIGASPAQVTRSVVSEALVIGAVASAVGMGFGLLIARALQAIFSSSGFGLPESGLVILPRTVAAALVVGVVVTVLAAVTPARRASAVSPVEGLREGVVPARRSSTRRAATGSALTLGGAVLLLLGLFAVEGTMTLVALMAVGSIAVFVGVGQLTPVVAVPVAGAIGGPLARHLRVAGRLAHADAVRNRDRTAKTASALMIGLALVTAVFVVGTSVKESFSASIEDAVAADYVLSTDGFVGFSPAITAELAALPELDGVTGVRFGSFLFEGEGKEVVAADPAAAGKVIDLEVQTGRVEDLDPTSILIHEDPARDLGLEVGDTVEVTLATGGPRQLTVAGTYADATYAGNYLIDLDLFAEAYPTTDLDQMVLAAQAPGVTAADARAAIDAVVADQPQVKVDDRAGFEEDQRAQLDSMLIAVNGLLGLALVIALLGIANTLALSVLERTREIGLLRAVGMLRRQVREMVLGESVMIAIFGAILGVALGALLGLATTAALPASVITTTVVPTGTIAIVVVAAAVCGVVAGVLPARRAARLDVLTAIASE
ncbi:ABC transporter permease [Iamia sp. SCSIO 61187]|uniref:ABC transporter permease n=1 Tax=Iamia sp. SCSIO 61187 TaxID=2722752 RepID=UPI001C630E60|nr:ABC transporter permease [Iamia sp. SCSIO 61187]QYG93535.1 ABC transporter permease [Iamia sp. SCSIO 61187]